MHKFVFLIIFSIFFVNCWAQKQEDHNDPAWKEKMKDLAKKMDGSKNTGALECVYYPKHGCWNNETLCSNVPSGGSCDCIVKRSYKVIKLNGPPKPQLLCPIGWHSTPNWLLFFAFIGFTVFSFFVFQCVRCCWPAISTKTQLALTGVQNYIGRQWDQQPTAQPVQQTFRMYNLNPSAENSCFSLEDEVTISSERQNIVDNSKATIVL